MERKRIAGGRETCQGRDGPGMCRALFVPGGCWLLAGGEERELVSGG